MVKVEIIINQIQTMFPEAEVELVDKNQEICITKEKEAEDPFRIRVGFPNNYGASIIRNNLSYGSGLEVEIGVISKEEGKWGLTYETPITNDVIGYLKEDDIYKVLKEIKAL